MIGEDGALLAANVSQGTVKVTTYLGREYQYVVETQLGEFIVNDGREKPYEHGERVTLGFPAEKLVPVL
ncbi:MAG: spermidine/putrescine transporter ATP-binding protein [Paenibacillus sp.]|nr:spermidine/putrescine transporter ATP-binding protein [Paenibacillus sp.]